MPCSVRYWANPSLDIGIADGLSTFGSRDKNFSIGLSYGYAAVEWADTPLISFSGMIRTGERGYFITENYLISSGDENVVMLSLEGRRIVKGVGIDSALVAPTQCAGPSCNQMKNQKNNSCASR